MKINVVNRQKDFPIKKTQVKKLVQAFLDFEDIACDEVNIHFISDEEMCELHDQYFDDPSSTDCISFPLDEEILGDVFVCPLTAIRYAEKKQLEVAKEVALYVIHGLLHLIGYDDLNRNDKIKMRRAEKRHMNNLTTLNIGV